MAPTKKRRVMSEENIEEEGEMESQEPNVAIPPPNISAVRNKERRKKLFLQMKKDKKAQKKAEQKKRRAMGDKVPKEMPHTIESLREKDDTMVTPEDEEVHLDEAGDEFASCFAEGRTPKILLTTSDRPCSRTNKFCKDLKLMIPNTNYYYRRGLDLKKVIPQAVAKGYTDIIVVNEDRKEPNGMLICHLPEGPTFHFKLSSIRLRTEMPKAGKPTSHLPEIFLHNFHTRLGHSVGRQLSALFPQQPDLTGRRCVAFHNQRDYVFVRNYRYQFRNAQKVGLQELGPQFTMRLRSVQKGTFDSKYGEFEFVMKRHEMESSRRKFQL